MGRGNLSTSFLCMREDGGKTKLTCLLHFRFPLRVSRNLLTCCYLVWGAVIRLCFFNAPTFYEAWSLAYMASILFSFALLVDFSIPVDSNFLLRRCELESMGFRFLTRILFFFRLASSQQCSCIFFLITKLILLIWALRLKPSLEVSAPSCRQKLSPSKLSHDN